MRKNEEIFLFIFILCMIPSHMQVAQVNILQKSISSPAGEKIVKKFLHIFHFQKWKIVPNLYITRGMGGEIHPLMPKY